MKEQTHLEQLLTLGNELLCTNFVLMELSRLTRLVFTLTDYQLKYQISENFFICKHLFKMI